MDGNLEQGEIESLMEEMATELTALFRMMESDMAEIVSKGASEGWTPERIVHEIDAMLGERYDSIQI